jgi:hypothetical protein
MSDWTHKSVGRLALRVEGDKWTAYYALPNTMERAIWLGSVMRALVDDQERKEAFIALMQDFIADFLENRTGQKPDFFRDPAPESERSGSA